MLWDKFVLFLLDVSVGFALMLFEMGIVYLLLHHPGTVIVPALAWCIGSALRRFYNDCVKEKP